MNSFLTDKGVPLLCAAILNRHYDSAELLLEYARECNEFVLIGTGKCATLDIGAVQGSVAIAKFVLDRVVAKRFTVDESCSILTNYLLPLTQKFPSLMRNYLERDAFSFEYGRVWASPSLFNDPDSPIAMTTDEKLTDWTSLDSTTAKEFWWRNCEEHRPKFDETSGVQVEAVAKFFCVHQHAVRLSLSDATVGVASDTSESQGQCHFLRALSQQSDLPVDVFNSDSLRIFTSWVFRKVAWRFRMFIIMNGFATALFFLLSQIFEDLDEDSDLSDFKPFVIFIMVLLLGVHTVGNITQHSRIK